MLVPLKLPPGVRANGTPYQTKGRWRDCNFVRWAHGVMQPIGGWQRITETPLAGRVGGMWPFRDNRLFTYLGVGTSQKLYVFSKGGPLDITPVEYSPGRNASSPGVGYGSAEYDRYSYGDARPAGGTDLILQATTWTLDSWGEFLVAVASSDGKAYLWKPGTATTPPDAIASLIPNAPQGINSLIVTPERHLCLIGVERDPRRVDWSDRGDYTTWEATPTNLAGSLPVQTQGRLLKGVRLNGEIIIIGDTDVFRMNYVGAPLAYGIELTGSNCGAVGMHAVAVADDFAAWMGDDGFYVFNGSVNTLQCEIQDWVYRSFDASQGALVSAGHNAEHSEIWWFFPTLGERKNTRYALWNYRDNTWATGYLSRAYWPVKGPWPAVVAAGEDSHIYEHEIDLDSELVEPRSKPYIESAPYEIGNGDQVMTVTQLIPDSDSLSLNALQYRFTGRQTPHDGPVTYGPYQPDDDGYTDVRFEARQVSIRVEAVNDVDWRLGVIRADVQPGGRR